MVNPAIDVVIQFALMFAIGAVMAVAFIAISHLLSPKSANPNKGEPYECGVVPKSDARMPFNVHYYLVAVLFVLFDLEAVFLVPWALVFRRHAAAGAGWFLLGEMLVFTGVILVGWLYLVRRGALDWD